MSRTVIWVTLDAALPMGQQLHESRLTQAIADLDPTDWHLATRRVTTLRSRSGGTVRVPFRPVGRLPYWAAADRKSVV